MTGTKSATCLQWAIIMCAWSSARPWAQLWMCSYCSFCLNMMTCAEHVAVLLHSFSLCHLQFLETSVKMFLAARQQIPGSMNSGDSSFCSSAYWTSHLDQTPEKTKRLQAVCRLEYIMNPNSHGIVTWMWHVKCLYCTSMYTTKCVKCFIVLFIFYYQYPCLMHLTASCSYCVRALENKSSTVLLSRCDPVHI